MELIEEIGRKPKDWTLNQDTLEELFNFFKKRFSKDIIRRKLAEMDIYYYNTSKK